MNELKALQNICEKYLEYDCGGCPFNNSYNNYGLNCDSGYYSKDLFKIDKIMEIIEEIENG